MAAAENLLRTMASRGRYHFTPEEFGAAGGISPLAVKRALNRLSRKGLVAHPSRGFWVIVPPEYQTLGCLPADQFIPALMERSGLAYYAGLLSAAQYHGAAHHRPQVFQAMIGGVRRPINCGKVTVNFHSRRSIAQVPTQAINTPRGSIKVSTPEATAIDLVGYEQHAGGLDNVATILAELAGQLEPRRLLLAARTAPLPWVQRLGYLLELADAGSKAELLKKEIRTSARNFTPLSLSPPSVPHQRNDAWRLLVNTTVDIES